MLSATVAIVNVSGFTCVFPAMINLLGEGSIRGVDMYLEA